MHDFGARQHPSVAVIVPTCRRPELLRLALASVAAQRPSPAEVVVVDVDGHSAPGVEQAFPGLRRLVLSGPAPAGRARNQGAATTSAEVLAFLDDDDTWETGYLAQAIAALSSGAAAVVTPLLVRAGAASRQLPPPDLALPARRHLARNPGVTGSNLVLLRSAFDAVGGYDAELTAFNDLDLLVRLLDAGIVPVVVERPLAHQRLHSGTQATTPSPQRLLALQRYVRLHGRRMSPGQRLHLAREGWWMRGRLATRMRARVGFRALQLASTPPQDLVRAYRHRTALGGARD